ncbi:hypothetical protein [Nocardiopsis suaedae]|uniref:Uncharacterized protein n=1 Tax=Nocardiopsis suaedae TaxID=3018444 RepID=A0ABT4TWA2_9ACTN|nr:hypothetical protein [Nocardiopsis suaedae]MDA2808968.1 hypothetical protein [Nocardiopsis suaedae]
MSVTDAAPRLEGDSYSRFVELALRYTRWGLGYTSDGTALLFTAAHGGHDVGFSCRDLDVFAACSPPPTAAWPTCPGPVSAATSTPTSAGPPTARPTTSAP